MDRKVCLDTDICIEIVKENYSIEYLFDKFAECDIFISSITVFELYLREHNLLELEEFVSNFQILSFDRLCALKGSEVLKVLRNKGEIIDFRDVFIAATCVVNNCSLLTLNKKPFERIKGLELIKLEK